MQRKNDIVVFGAESTGTRFVTQTLIRLGFVGSSDHVQPLDSVGSFEDVKGRVVFRRSFPHNKTWPDPSEEFEKFGSREVDVIVTTRDWFSCSVSQVANGHVVSEVAAIKNVQEAYKKIFKAVADKNYVMVDLNSLTSEVGPLILAKALGIVGVEVPPDFDFKINQQVIINRIGL